VTGDKVCLSMLSDLSNLNGLALLIYLGYPQGGMFSIYAIEDCD
jgi:hypothetical protein